MPRFCAADGTELAYHVQGAGAPLVCLPGGLVLAGGVDLPWPPSVVSELTALFPAARFVVQPGAGHYPWLDDPEWFVSALTAFLAA